MSSSFSAVNDWNELQKSLKLETLISLTSFKHQLSEQLSQITAPLHSQSVNSPSNYLIPILYLFIYLVPLHPSISSCTFIFCTSITPVLICEIVIISPLPSFYCLTSLILLHLHTHTVYRLFYCVIDCTFVYSTCNSVLLFVAHRFALSWPGRSCK